MDISAIINAKCCSLWCLAEHIDKNISYFNNDTLRNICKRNEELFTEPTCNDGAGYKKILFVVVKNFINETMKVSLCIGNTELVFTAHKMFWNSHYRKTSCVIHNTSYTWYNTRVWEHRREKEDACN